MECIKCKRVIYDGNKIYGNMHHIDCWWAAVEADGGGGGGGLPKPRHLLVNQRHALVVRSTFP